MADGKDPFLEAGNRAAHRVARAELLRRAAARELWEADPWRSPKREAAVRARRAPPRAAKALDDALDDALDEYERLTRRSQHTVLAVGEPYPEEET